MEFVFIVWLAFAIITAIIASSKGRSGMGWFVLAAFIGFFATILVIGMPALNSPQAGNHLPRERLPWPARIFIFILGMVALLHLLGVWDKTNKSHIRSDQGGTILFPGPAKP